MNVEGGGQIYFQVLVGGLYTAGWSEYHLILPYSIIGNDTHRFNRSTVVTGHRSGENLAAAGREDGIETILDIGVSRGIYCSSRVTTFILYHGAA